MVADNAVGWLREQCSQGDLVPHGTGQDEEAGFLASESGNVGLEVRGRGIFLEYVVQKSCCLDSTKHSRCWGRHGIA